MAKYHRYDVRNSKRGNHKKHALEKEFKEVRSPSTGTAQARDYFKKYGLRAASIDLDDEIDVDDYWGNTE